MTQDKLTDKEIIEIANIPEGWEVFKVANRENTFVKIRRIYPEGAINFNEDGYEYKSIFITAKDVLAYRYPKLKEENTKLLEANKALIEALQNIVDEIPPKPTMPITITIQSIAKKALQQYKP